jgi:hypothetical protein
LAASPGPNSDQKSPSSPISCCDASKTLPAAAKAQMRRPTLPPISSGAA